MNLIIAFHIISCIFIYYIFNTCGYQCDKAMNKNDTGEVISRGRGVLPHMGHIGMCRCEGYGPRPRKTGIATQTYKQIKSAKFKFSRLSFNSVDT